MGQEAFPKIAESDGLILDIRTNSGGSGNVAYEVLSYLIDKPVATSRTMTRKYNPTDRARGSLLEWTEQQGNDLKPHERDRYTKPVVVLTSAATFSAAEDFLVAWKNSGRGKTIGEPSGGSTGQPLFFSLPGGGQARVCTKRDTFPDGREWVGKGIEPDILVRPTAADLAVGRDTVLERALENLRAVAVQPVPKS